MVFRLGELFCGPGGIALGARDANLALEGTNFSIRHEWANDYDKDTCDTYVKNMCPESPKSVICKDVRKLDLKKLTAIDALAFGFPCNDFSVVGEKKGIDGIYGPLYSYGVKVLKRFQPSWFLAENVGGLRNSNDGSAFQTIIDELTKQSENVIERLKYIKPGENCFTAKLPKHLQLNIKGAQISQIYKRLDPNKPAYTVTGSGGGGTHIYHWKENRALTNRERARLQTFPDDFIFCGSKESVRKQIGMAVPPRGAKIIFESILKTFAGIPYDSVAPNIETKNRDLFGNMVLEPSEEYLAV